VSNWFLDWNSREVFNETYLNYKREYESGIEQQISDDDLIQLTKKLSITYALANSQDSFDFVQRYLDFLNNQLEDAQSGRQTAESIYDLQAKQLYYEHLSRLGNSALYKDAQQYPLIEMMASLFLNRTPLAIYAAIGIFSFIAAKNSHRNKLLGNRQLTFVKFHISKCLSILFTGIISFAISIAPLLVYALVRNGLGLPDYPVVFRRGGEIIYSSALQLITSQLILICLFSILVITFYELLLTISKEPTISLLIVFILLCVPFYPKYFLTRDFQHSIIKWIPLTYLDSKSIVGALEIFPTTDVFKFGRISYFEVCLETLLWIFILIVMTLIIALINKAVVKSKLITQGCCQTKGTSNEG
jgi:ABC transporter related protein